MIEISDEELKERIHYCCLCGSPTLNLKLGGLCNSCRNKAIEYEANEK